ncbi:CAMK/CAMKL/GIN4 protein kinase [Mycena sanguinolenta]|uniref:CAMK/CAMKL/GIN4 protein kinase n=1 Tax=Mycena sanguinolenta TaxID=230812 RepID=A0A8H6Z4Q3_9AGAR|nr:CAMK/CAMKL/GIN4 protein kinase [Mycena sanguinolenta]
MAKTVAPNLARGSSPETYLEPSLSSLPPRDGPPTPRRAARSGIHSASDDSLADRVRVPAINSCSPTPSPQLSSPTAPIVDPSSLPPLAVPDLKDEKMQAFFHQIVTNLNALQAKIGTDPGNLHGSPNLDLMCEVFGDMSLPNAPPSTLATSYIGGPRPASAGTRPLSVRRKTQPSRPTVDTNIGNKENIGDCVAGAGDVGSSGIVKKSSLKSKDQRSKTKEAFSDTGSSFTLPSPSLSSPISSSPKRTWLENVFSFKPITYTLSSMRDFYTTRNECRRLLMRMDVRVVLEDSEGLGVLKCRLDEARDPDGPMAVVKAAKFRVEVQRSFGGEDVTLLLVHEKGSVDSFKEVCKRLRRDWVMNDPDAPLHHAISPSPIPGDVW